MSEITKDWLDGHELFRREPYSHAVVGTDLFVYYHRSGCSRGMWSIERECENGDEETLCYVWTRDQLLRMLSLLRRVRLLAPIMWDAEQDGDSDG